MKKIIVLIAALTALAWYHKTPPPRLVSPPPIPAEASNSSLFRMQSIRKRELLPLREELADLDHELERAGYPEVMLDERLSESERAEIVAKVMNATSLYNRIVQIELRESL